MVDNPCVAGGWSLYDWVILGWPTICFYLHGITRSHAVIAVYTFSFSLFQWVVYMIDLVQSNDKLMPNSCLGQNLLANHHGIAVSRNSCLSHAQILKHHGIAMNRVCIRRMFPHLGKSNVRKNPSTVAFYRSCFWG